MSCGTKPTQFGGCGRREQDGGCGEQFGGARRLPGARVATFNATAISARDKWLAEVRAVQEKSDVSWKEAMIIAKMDRKDAAAKQGREYLTMAQRNEAKGAALRFGREHWESEVDDALLQLRKSNPKATRKEAMVLASEARKRAGVTGKTIRELVQSKPGFRPPEGHGPYGSKNKRPVTFDAAKKILLQYYRDRAAQFKRGPRAGLKRDISSCKKDEFVLTPCTHSTKKVLPNGKEVVEWFPEACRDSWKYRPGSSAKGPTGPGVYDMEGVDNLCKKKGRDPKSSPLYNMGKMRRTPVSEESRLKRSIAMKAKWAAMTPAQKEAIKAKRRATLAAKAELAQPRLP